MKATHSPLPLDTRTLGSVFTMTYIVSDCHAAECIARYLITTRTVSTVIHYRHEGFSIPERWKVTAMVTLAEHHKILDLCK